MIDDAELRQLRPEGGTRTNDVQPHVRGRVENVRWSVNGANDQGFGRGLQLARANQERRLSRGEHCVMRGRENAGASGRCRRGSGPQADHAVAYNDSGDSSCTSQLWIDMFR